MFYFLSLPPPSSLLPLSLSLSGHSSPVGSPEFHTQSTFGQNTLWSLLLAGGFTRIPHPRLEVHNTTKTTTNTDYLHNLSNPNSQIQQEIHIHTHGWKFTTQSTHTTEITNATTENTPNRPTKEESTENLISPEITLQPLDDDPQSAPLLAENRRLCSMEIGASARRKSAHLLTDNRRLCLHLEKKHLVRFYNALLTKFD